jgi:hypothetical protein
MSLFISSVFTYDEDAGNYIQAVEAADAQALEPATRKAINNFVIGCKQDGIWTAIKASCILAGARTLSGALVPLAGTAPTNVGGLFVSGDYNRKTGLAGNGSTKSLLSNRLGNSDPQDSQHMSVYVSTRPTGPNQKGYIGEAGAVGASYIFYNVSTTSIHSSSRTNNNEDIVSAPTHTGLVGISRSNSSNYGRRLSGSTTSLTKTSAAGSTAPIYVFALGDGGSTPFFHSNASLAFYSIGESLDLALLDARVTNLINAFAVTIP